MTRSCMPTGSRKSIADTSGVEAGSPPQAKAAKAFGLPGTCRIKTAREFRRVYGRGVRVRSRGLIVVAFKRRQPGHRLGLAVSKEHGCAVRRNKIKRIFREAFRLERPELPGRYDLVLIPQKREGKYILEEIRHELRQLISDLVSGKGQKRRKGRPSGGKKRAAGGKKRAGPKGRGPTGGDRSGDGS